MNLTPELERARIEIEGYARECGLDFFDTIFEMINYRQMNEVASYGGLPSRYPHWRFGMDYDRLSKGYTFGLHKIYEMVINNDPCYAYLLEANPMVIQKMVMAHVYAHCDFFKNNLWFAETNRKMIDEMANHGTRIRRYIDKYGLEKVESFLDMCLSIENLVDPLSPFIKRKRDDWEEGERKEYKKLRSKPYMDKFINPPEFLRKQKEKEKLEEEKKKKFPEDPQKDTVYFLLEHAPVDAWQKDVLSMIREESYYFAPQRQTKILNEGWATYWHSTILTRKALGDSEIIDYADVHSSTLGGSPGVINPYKIGLLLLRDIEDRWNKGRFGKEWEECQDRKEKSEWDRGLGEGREKIFEVRKLYNDVTFIDTFLTDEFCRENKLFTYEFNAKSGYYEIASRMFEKIKAKLLFSLTNFGDPFIYVTDGNYKNRGELYLLHRFEGIELKHDYAKETLASIQKIWNRPVNLETVVEGRSTLLAHDGSEVKETTLN